MYCYLKNQQDGHVCLGNGCSGYVKLAMNVVTKELVAIKSIYNRSITHELAIHKELRHPNIIKLLDFHVDTAQRKTSMILEYADDGNLQEHIKERTMDKKTIRSLFWQVCQAVKYLHDRCTVHGDIKVQIQIIQPENILLTKDRTAKLCDFGSSSLFGLTKVRSGTLQYMPPEVFLELELNEKVDIWALGILLFEMVSGEVPFKGLTKEQILESMKQTIPFSTEFDLDEIDLIKTILRVSTQKRPGINSILLHKYFNNMSTKPSTFASTICSRQIGAMLSPRKVRKISAELGKFQSQSKILERIRSQFRVQSQDIIEDEREL